MLNQEVAVVAGLRTAIGSFNGGIATVAAHQLSAPLLRKLLVIHNIEPASISEVIMGQILSAGCKQNSARQSAVAAGIPDAVPAWTINQVCGSGLKSIALGAQSIALGESSIVIAGGHENMSLAPHLINLRNGMKFGSAILDDSMIVDGLTDAFSGLHMGLTAENIVERFGITRGQQDEFALCSQHKASEAQKAGKFQAEIVSVAVPSKNGEVLFEQDEHIRHDASYDTLSGLRPAFKRDGTVTAGNSSGINDGAAAVLLMSKVEAMKRDLKPMAIIKSFRQVGVDPAIMGVAPILASREALGNAQMDIGDLDLIEVNEAFAAQSIYVNKEMGWDIKKVNVNGGAIALGHPIGASGARILVTLLHEMSRRGVKRGLATLCIGGGMGVAMCVENDTI